MKFNYLSCILFFTSFSIFVPVGSFSISSAELYASLSSFIYLSQISFEKHLNIKYHELIFLTFLLVYTIGEFFTEGALSRNFIRSIAKIIVFVAFLKYFDSSSINFHSIRNTILRILFILSVFGILNFLLGPEIWSQILDKIRLIPPDSGSRFAWYNTNTGIFSLFPLANAYAIYLTFLLLSLLSILHTNKSIISQSILPFSSRLVSIVYLFIVNVNLLLCNSFISLLQLLLFISRNLLYNLFCFISDLSRFSIMLKNLNYVNIKTLILAVVASLLLYPFVIVMINSLVFVYQNIELFTQSSDPSYGSEALRLFNVASALDIIKSNPLRLFSGFSIAELSDMGYTSDPHNWFISILLRQGLVSFLLLLSFFFSLLIVCFDTKNPHYFYLLSSLLVFSIAGGPLTDLRVYCAFLVAYFLCRFSQSPHLTKNYFE